MAFRSAWCTTALESLRWNEQTMNNLEDAFGTRKAFDIMFEALLESIETSTGDEPDPGVLSLVRQAEDRVAISGSGPTGSACHSPDAGQLVPGVASERMARPWQHADSSSERRMQRDVAAAAEQTEMPSATIVRSEENWVPDDVKSLDLGTCRDSGLLVMRAQNTCKKTDKGMDWAFLSGQLTTQQERLAPWLKQEVLSMPCSSCNKWYVLKAIAFEDHKAMIEYARDSLGWNRTKKRNGSYWSCPRHCYFGSCQTWAV